VIFEHIDFAVEFIPSITQHDEVARALTCLNGLRGKRSQVSCMEKKKNLSGTSDFTYRRNSASSLSLASSNSSILAFRLFSMNFAFLLASEWAEWFMSIARSRAELRDSARLCRAPSEKSSRLLLQRTYLFVSLGCHEPVLKLPVQLGDFLHGGFCGSDSCYLVL
jgi:hypothetical protein